MTFFIYWNVVFYYGTVPHERTSVEISNITSYVNMNYNIYEWVIGTTAQVNNYEN